MTEKPRIVFDPWAGPEMVRRVALVLCKVFSERDTFANDQYGDCDSFLEAAKAAIEAMREPTEAMKAPVRGILLEFPDVWQIMIDAALKGSS